MKIPLKSTNVIIKKYGKDSDNHWMIVAVVIITLYLIFNP